MRCVLCCYRGVRVLKSKEERAVWYMDMGLGSALLRPPSSHWLFDALLRRYTTLLPRCSLVVAGRLGHLSLVQEGPDIETRVGLLGSGGAKWSATALDCFTASSAPPRRLTRPLLFSLPSLLFSLSPPGGGGGN